MAIVKRIADMMGGKVGVESELGVGSRFWMTAQLAIFDVVIDGTFEENTSEELTSGDVDQDAILKANFRESGYC